MARLPTVSLSDLTLRLQVSGPLTAVELAAVGRVDRSRVSRLFTDAGEERGVVQIGAARRARYALRRRVRAAGDRWPIHRLDATGRAHEWAQWEAFHGGYRLLWAGQQPDWARLMVDEDGWIDGMPFFVGDLRPQGFVGRSIGLRVGSGLGLPTDIGRWGDDETIMFLQAEGSDLPGDLVVGESPLRRALAEQMESDQVVDSGEVDLVYPRLAASAMETGLPGSSAGGEQPKFLTRVTRSSDSEESCAVIVKFSPPLESQAGQRWADLLAAEGHALVVLVEAGEAMGGSRVFDAGGRRFLEAPRFDRVGDFGRRGVVSLAALEGTMENTPSSDWGNLTAELAEAGLVDSASVQTVLRRAALGELIGNSDMHSGNLAFWLDDGGPLQVAPTYDMLPMLWAPAAGGELVPRRFAPRPPTPTQAESWATAAGWAVNFWGRVAADSMISEDFRSIAEQAGEQVENLLRRFG